jgi:hypothetical protein
MPREVAAALAQLGGVAAATGEIFEDATHVVSLERDAALRPGPGWRAVQIVEAADPDAAVARLSALGDALKTIGVAGDLAPLAAALPRAHVVPAGTMQTPPFDAPQDGEPPWIDAVR